jgi:hypothetical protein
MRGIGLRPPLPIVPVAPRPRPHCIRCEGKLHRPGEALYVFGDVMLCHFCVGHLTVEEASALPRSPRYWIVP